MIGKIISHGRNRNEAIKNLTSYLSEFEIAGITTNLNLLKNFLKIMISKKGILIQNLLKITLKNL